MLAHNSAAAFALCRPPFQGHLNSGQGPLAMAGQASSWLHLDNGLVSLGAMWKPRPCSLIHGRWNEQESKILPRDIVAVRLRADPALHSRWWGQALYFSPVSASLLLGGKWFKVTADQPVMIQFPADERKLLCNFLFSVRSSECPWWSLIHPRCLFHYSLCCMVF